MSYIHCGDCDWSQDDFWSRRYNPITKIWGCIKWLWVPRIISMEDWVISDIGEYTGVPIWRRGQKIFSWNWLLVELVKEIKLFREQEWWTRKSWIGDKQAACPKCKCKMLIED